MASAHCERHVFQVLTKRPGRAWTYLTGPLGFALPNVWLGVECRGPTVGRGTHPGVAGNSCRSERWLSAEPLLGEMNRAVTILGDDLYLDALTGGIWVAAHHLPLPRRMPGID